MQSLMREEPYFAFKSPDYNFSFGTIPPPTRNTTLTSTAPTNDINLQLLKEINTDLVFLGSHLNRAFPPAPLTNLPKLYQESAVEIGTQVNIDNPKPPSTIPPENYMQTSHNVTKRYKPLAYSPYYNGRIKEEPFRCIKKFYGGYERTNVDMQKS